MAMEMVVVVDVRTYGIPIRFRGYNRTLDGLVDWKYYKNLEWMPGVKKCL